MKSLVLALLVMFTISSCTSNGDYQLVWSDEFDYEGLPDSTKWSYDTEGNAWDWGNNELQHYTNHCAKNAHVVDGKLIVRAEVDTILNRNYTSARLITKGKGDWLYGRIEVCAKVTGGKGAWPAIWMLPTNWEYGSWPKSGEIDIMEHVGYEPDSVYFTVHTEAYNHVDGTQKSRAVYNPSLESEFHVYAVDWTDKKCVFYLDNKEVFVFKKEPKCTSKQWPFDKHFYLVLNLAVGGNWGGVYGVDNSIFPCQMEVDYVRVYQPANEKI